VPCSILIGGISRLIARSSTPPFRYFPSVCHILPLARARVRYAPELDVFCNRGELGGEREGNEDQPEATQVKVDPLTELVFRRSIFFATEEFVGDGACWFTSTLCLIREDGLTFRRAKEFTPLVAGLIYMQRLLFFEYALPYRTYARVGYERRPKRNHLDRLDLIRLRYRVP